MNFKIIRNKYFFQINKIKVLLTGAFRAFINEPFKKSFNIISMKREILTNILRVLV